MWCEALVSSTRTKEQRKAVEFITRPFVTFASDGVGLRDALHARPRRPSNTTSCCLTTAC